jgi:hypothetical protein
MQGRWYALPLIAVVLVVSGFVMLIVLAEDPLTDMMAAAFILIGGVFAGLFTGVTVTERAGRKRPR